MSNYSLEVISKLLEFSNKTFKKHHVAGIDTIGVWGSEPFEIKFKNHSFETVQVKISIDGTDILTGDTANTEVNKEMWVVRGYEELVLKAWPENHNGGAQFIFTHAGSAVATHTHGDTSNMGIIAVAVFREGYKEPARFVEKHHHYYHNYWWSSFPYFWGQDITYGINNVSNNGGTYGSSTNSTLGNFTMDYLPVEEEAKSLPGVGAGNYIEQNITYTTGLKNPYFSEIVRVKYLWWDDLVEELKKNNEVVPHASGFPGDNNKLINLKSTPRIETNQPIKKAPQNFLRF